MHSLFLVLSFFLKSLRCEEIKKKREMVYFSPLPNTTQSWWLLYVEPVLYTYYLIIWALWGHWRIRKKEETIKTTYSQKKWRKLWVNHLFVGDQRIRNLPPRCMIKLYWLRNRRIELVPWKSDFLKLLLFFGSQLP